MDDMILNSLLVITLLESYGVCNIIAFSIGAEEYADYISAN